MTGSPFLGGRFFYAPVRGLNLTGNREDGEFNREGLIEPKVLGHEGEEEKFRGLCHPLPQIPLAILYFLPLDSVLCCR
jgi:hypothetical protein